MTLPRITLVTPSFNQAHFLEETIVSVLSQEYPNLEYMIIDGGSTDASVEILHKYNKFLAYCVSERDRGQTDAIRKGFARATGEVMNWLNSDDLLAPGALWHIAEMVKKQPDTAIYAAAVENFTDGAFDGPRQKSIPANLTVEGCLFRNGQPVHRHQPGIFFRKVWYEAIHGFQDNYFMCMDFDLHLRMLACNAEVMYSEQTIAYFRSHTMSKTQGGNTKNTLRAIQEYMAICEQTGKKLSMRPNHRAAHLKTLVGAARSSATRYRWHDTLNIVAFAARLAILGR